MIIRQKSKKSDAQIIDLFDIVARNNADSVLVGLLSDMRTMRTEECLNEGLNRSSIIPSQ
ncbi:hypothetical protein RND71_034284 [Anisodus tanguticus]|uniref:Uncharacterized protein n=1 Tax=Anisodus tanguticus TaxID=243964 RepID=A0AAE1R9B8_9SOLA|nr:hypothetical protein RND71_034284 [Anisodus tanguticus]